MALKQLMLTRERKEKTALLETWQTIALEDILGRELIVDSCYVPIEGQALRQNLMSLSA